MLMLTAAEFVQATKIKPFNVRRVPEGKWLTPENKDDYPLQRVKYWWITEDGHWKMHWPSKDIGLYPQTTLAKEYFVKYFTEEAAFGKDHTYHSMLATQHILERFYKRTEGSNNE